VKLFDLEARGTTVAREVRGGTATFLTMAYILFANPAILAAAGMPFGPVVAATAAASAIASLLMALGANFPIALAPGMGLNAVIAYQVAPAAGSWQAAMGLRDGKTNQGTKDSACAMCNVCHDKGVRDSRNDANHKPSNEEVHCPPVNCSAKAVVAVGDDAQQTKKAVSHSGEPHATSIESKIKGVASHREEDKE